MLNKLISNFQRLLTTPGMLPAYANWQFNKRILKKLPSVSCSPTTKVTGWLNFSEYWSFRNGIPTPERLFILDCIKQSPGERSQEKKVTFDVGANIGLFTVMLAGLDNIEVHAFEPIGSTFERLSSNVTFNHFSSNVYLNLTAVGSEQGNVEFDTYADSPAINRLSNTSLVTSQSTAPIRQKVTVITLDGYCQEKGIEQIDFLKIDVEGMEAQVLQGAKKMLKAQKVSGILIEICPNNLKVTGNSVELLHSTILESGYLPYKLSPHGLPNQLLDISDLKQIVLENVVLVASPPG